MSADDPKYPIYRVSAEWVQDCDPSRDDRAKYPDSWWYRDMPPNRMRNRTGFDVMRRERDDVAEAIRTTEWWEGYRAKKEEGGNWTDAVLETVFAREETWCLSWFSHWTFDDGKSDQEYLASFDRFCRRMQRLNDEARMKWDGDGYFTEPYCLMGAEDRYRWCARSEGTGIIGCGPTTGDAPCRCDGCKSNGVVRIDH